MNETLLFLAHTNADGSLPTPALEALAAALQLAAELQATFCAGLVGDDVQPSAAVLAGAGCARVYAVTGPAFGVSRYATDVAAAEALCRRAEASIVIAPGTTRWQRALPGVAARLDGRCDTHATLLCVEDARPLVTRFHYRQRIEASFCRTKRPWIILAEPGSRAPWSGMPAAGGLETVDVPLNDAHLRTKVAAIEAPGADRQTIRPDAALLFVAGAGWTKKQGDGQAHASEAGALILGFLDRADASLGGTKSLVDQAGEGQAVLPFMTHLNQVGQTGSTPRHSKGLATCCHGEEPHVVGWRFVNERRAINLDPNCGWTRGKADVVYVADAFEVMRKINELL